jgi:uncharacterized coiled-coil protein SlyX
MQTLVRDAVSCACAAQLRREIPETVAACQAALDEQLPRTLKAAASPGDLAARLAAAVAAHDAQLPKKQEEVRALVSRLYAQQEQQIVHAASEQQARAKAPDAYASFRMHVCLTPRCTHAPASAMRRSGMQQTGTQQHKRARRLGDTHEAHK